MTAFGLCVDPGLVCIFGETLSKHAALDKLVDVLASDKDLVTDTAALRQAVFAREEVMSTGIGQGVAVPHARVDAVKTPCLAVGISKKGIEYGAVNNEPVHIIVLFAMPIGAKNVYLGLLAQVMQTLRTPGFREQLIACQTPDEAVVILNR